MVSGIDGGLGSPKNNTRSGRPSPRQSRLSRRASQLIWQFGSDRPSLSGLDHCGYPDRGPKNDLLTPIEAKYGIHCDALCPRSYVQAWFPHAAAEALRFGVLEAGIQLMTLVCLWKYFLISSLWTFD
jgi:hypothetical protein